MPGDKVCHPIQGDMQNQTPKNQTGTSPSLSPVKPRLQRSMLVVGCSMFSLGRLPHLTQLTHLTHLTQETVGASLHTRLNQLEAGLARVDERTKN